MSASLNVSEWDSFVAGFQQKHPGNSTSTSGAHILQTSTWATLKCNFGWSATRIVARQQGRTVAGAQILFRPLPLGLGNIAYLPKGPLVDWSDIEQCKYIMSLCDEVCRARRALFLIVEPDLANNEFANNVLNTLGLTPGTQTVQPRRTITISLKTDQTEILAKMKQKTRYNIRLAERSGVKVRIATSETIDTDLLQYQNLIESTGDRSGFGVHSAKYYSDAYHLFAPAKQVALLMAEYRGKPLASLMVFSYGGRAWYFYGASSGEERERMPAYALQWAAIVWAKEHGCYSYDMWGVPDEEPDYLEAEFTSRKDGLWPVYRFKRGFGGELERSVGPWERIYYPWAQRLYKRVLAARSGDYS